jgi:hypothetical protein
MDKKQNMKRIEKGGVNLTEYVDPNKPQVVKELIAKCDEGCQSNSDGEFYKMITG